ncbi:SNF2-related protein, partial [Lacticaseibacillus paracasei]
MAISMPDRNHVAALITTFNQTSQSLQGWQDKITTATVALVEHAHALHDAEVAAALAATPVPSVVATGKPVNTALTAAGIDSLAALHQALDQTPAVAGLSLPTCRKLTTMVNEQAAAIAATTPLTVDFTAQRDLSLALVRTAIAWPVLQATQKTIAALASDESALGLTIAALPVGRLNTLGWLFIGTARKQQAVTAAIQLDQAVPQFEAAANAALADITAAAPLTDEAVMAAFTKDAASFYALFEDIGLAGTEPAAVSLNPFAPLAETDSAATDGPDAFIVMMNRVAGIDFHSSLLTAHLRGWQAFGVRYALAQRRILLGDEMGLGKTLEALGVITARLAQGDTHALVVAPIGVLANWQREVAKHTMLTAYLIHGDQRTVRMADWRRNGGVALINYEQLWRLPTSTFTALDVLVADEAQALTNPRAKRTQAVTTLAKHATTVMYMTGTPIQNQLSDMLNLIRPLQPDLCATLEAGSQFYEETAFKRLIAPVYLRRNRDDVLKELPPIEQQNVWLGMSARERAGYVSAVQNADFMAMRQAG